MASFKLCMDPSLFYSPFASGSVCRDLSMVLKQKGPVERADQGHVSACKQGSL